MARIVLILLVIALTVYAVADWALRSKEWTPGRVNRWLWLAVIVVLPAIGPLAWIVTGAVTRAEASQGDFGEPSPPAPVPDDDPDGISAAADRIARRQKRSRPGPGSTGRDADTTPNGRDGKDSPRDSGNERDPQDPTRE